MPFLHSEPFPKVIAEVVPASSYIKWGRHLLCATAFESARQYARASKAAKTLRAYRNDLSDFELWCHDFGT